MILPAGGAALLTAVRERRPLIHHLANFVTMGDVAAATRVTGALPVMALAPEEMIEVVGQADALVISLGTPTRYRLEALPLALEAAVRRGLPVVLDPVGVGTSAWRTQAAETIVHAARPLVIRANAAEAAALLARPAHIRGVEAVGEHDAASLASGLGRVVGVAAVTGPRDYISDGAQTVGVDNGHPWLAALSGAGCMATAVVGAFCAVAGRGERLVAAAAALAYFGLAAERAAERAAGPGTLKAALLDALFALTPEDLQTGARYVVGAVHAPR